MYQKKFLSLFLSFFILNQPVIGSDDDFNTDPPVYPDDSPAVTMPLEDSDRAFVRDEPVTSLERPKKIHSDDRILDLEDQVRELRGQIEELHHQLKSTQEKAVETSSPQSHKPESNADHKTNNKEETQALKSEQTTAEEQYEQAQDYLSQQAYPEAERTLKQLIDKHPQDPLIINAHYWLGESYYIQKNYPRAAIAFSEVYKTYRVFKKDHATDANSTLQGSFAKVPEALIKLTLTLKAMGKTAQACTPLEQLHSEFPQLPANIKKKIEMVEEELPQCKKADQK
ncbi:MAG: tetratricopeptide repeat protein [Janthinobacterium lividum]